METQPPRKGEQQPHTFRPMSFRPMSIVAKRSPISATAELLLHQPTRSTQPCIPPGSLNRVPASAGGKGWNWNVTSAGWQVTLCDPIWHVSSSSGVATSVSELLYPCYFTLLYFTLPSGARVSGRTCIIFASR